MLFYSLFHFVKKGRPYMAHTPNRYQVQVNGCTKAVGTPSRMAEVLSAWSGVSVSHAQHACKVGACTVRVLRYLANAYAKQNPDLSVHVGLVDEYEAEKERQAIAQQAIEADALKVKKEGVDIRPLPLSSTTRFGVGKLTDMGFTIPGEYFGTTVGLVRAKGKRQKLVRIHYLRNFGETVTLQPVSGHSLACMPGAPFNTDFIEKARSLAGRFSDGVWMFDARIADRVRTAAYEVYGCDGVRCNQCTIELDVNATLEGRSGGQQAPVYFLGRTLARATGRDGGAKLGDGVVVLSGGFSSGGSVKNWITTVLPDTRVLLHDMPREAGQSLIDDGATYLKIIEEEGVPGPVFDFLAQAGVVSELLDKITKILPATPDSDAKTALVDHLRTFENTVVLTTWNTADVSAHLKNGINEEDAKAVLEVMVSRYGVEESDWDAITTAYEICQALDADSQII